MRHISRRIIQCLLAVLGPALVAHAGEPSESNSLLKGMQPLMVCCTKRAVPSQQEWTSMVPDTQQYVLPGSIGDFKSKTVSFNNTRYYTLNAPEGTLASYGKMVLTSADRFAQIEGVECSVDKNSWKERYVMNAAAMLNLTGSRFLEYAGVGLQTAVDKNRQIDVTFLGTAVPKDKVIRQLNNDLQALEYFDTLQQKQTSYNHDSFKLVKTAPAAPKVVLANVVMLTGDFSHDLNADVDASVQSRILQDGVELKLTMKNGEQRTLLSPIVRCYRTYSINFKLDDDGNPVRGARTDQYGTVHLVPQIFDLTPDI